MINTQGYYMTSKGEKVIIDSQNFIDLSYKNIVELVLPSGIKNVWCANNQLKELILPSSIIEVWCSSNQITGLILPSGVKNIYCENNNITGLILPSGVEYVYCDDGAIENPMFYKNWDINLVIYLMK